MTIDIDSPRSTEALIARLTAHVRPVRRSWSPSARFLGWLALELVVLIAARAVLGFRPGLASDLGGVLGAEVVLLLGLGLVNALLALLAAVPGREPSPVLGAVSVIGLVALAVVYAFGPELGQSGHQLGEGWPCGARTIAVAALPWLVLLVVVRRGATLVPARAGLLAAIAAFFVSAAALRLVCPLDAREHLLLWHLGPVALGLVASLVIGRRWLARWRG